MIGIKHVDALRQIGDPDTDTSRGTPSLVPGDPPFKYRYKAEREAGYGAAWGHLRPLR